MSVTSSVIVGSILYKACVAIAIKLGMPSSDLKLITAVLFLAILVIGMERKTKVKTAPSDGAETDTADGTEV
jgi:putative ABC transport system permease protein